MNQKQTGTGSNPQRLQQKRRRERRGGSEGIFFMQLFRSVLECEGNAAYQLRRLRNLGLSTGMWQKWAGGTAYLLWWEERASAPLPSFGALGTIIQAECGSGRQGAKGWVFTLDSSFAHKPMVPGSGKCGGLEVRAEGESWRASSTRAKDR